MFDKFQNAHMQTDFNIRVGKFQQNDAFWIILMSTNDYKVFLS